MNQKYFMATFLFNIEIEPGYIEGKWWSLEPTPVLFTEKILDGLCPDDMIYISGGMLDDGGLGSWNNKSIESLQKTTCTKWIEKKYPERCASFDRDKWLEISSRFPRKPMSFCIDKYEWPNKKDA